MKQPNNCISCATICLNPSSPLAVSYNYDEKNNIISEFNVLIDHETFFTLIKIHFCECQDLLVVHEYLLALISAIQNDERSI